MAKTLYKPLKRGVCERVEKHRRLATKQEYAKQNACEESKVIRIDEAQLDYLMEGFTERIEWATNRIVDESKPSYVSIQNATTNGDGFSWLLKCIIGLPIILFGISIVAFLFNSAKEYWIQGGNMQLLVIILGIAAFDCFCLGVEVIREKDRNYIVALFSALASLVALIVALVK